MSELRARTLHCPASVPAALQRLTSLEDELFVVDLGVIARKVRHWTHVLPGVGCFFAVKALPDPVVLKALASMGAGFDCASAGEMECVLGLGVAPERIILSHACKLPSAIVTARKHGVRWMTFDNAYEVKKVHQLYPDAQFVEPCGAVPDVISSFLFSFSISIPISIPS